MNSKNAKPLPIGEPAPDSFIRWLTIQPREDAGEQEPGRGYVND